jgi:hypothetical protein
MHPGKNNLILDEATIGKINTPHTIMAVITFLNAGKS